MRLFPHAVLVRAALLAFPLGASGLAGCHSFHLDQPIAGKADKPNSPAALAMTPPSRFSFRVHPYLFMSDFELKPEQPLFRELAHLRDQVYKELKLPTGNTLVNVYLFEDREKYDRFMHAKYPDLPKRRAFFVAQPRVGGTEDLLVYTYWGDRIQEDLRHELTHALLHSVLKDVPLWLDEGLAEYFEVPPEAKGINAHHLDLIREKSSGPFVPFLARLEGFSQVQQMTPAEYREAWAWVHFMLNDKPETKAVLVNYLQQLRVNPKPGLLGPKLIIMYPALNDTLIEHLTKLDSPTSLRTARTPLKMP